MTESAKPAAEHSGALDINEAFRSGGCSPAFLDQINKACIVMAEVGIVPRATAARIAAGIKTVIEQMQASGVPRRSADYLDYEPRLTAVVGADASRLHSGRSRQDLASAMARMNLRDGLLQEIGALNLTVTRHHGPKTEPAQIRLQRWYADDSAAITNHHVDRLRRRQRCRHDEIAFIFTIFVIRHDDESPGGDIADGVLNAIKRIWS